MKKWAMALMTAVGLLAGCGSNGSPGTSSNTKSTEFKIQGLKPDEGKSLQTNNDSPAFKLQFNRDLRTLCLKGKVGLARQAMVRSGDHTEEDYCAIQG